MAKGIEISNGTTRTLSLDGVAVATGGNLNRAGLYVIGNKLYLDGAVIAESNNAIGLIRKADGLYFGDVQVGSDTPEPPTPPTPVESGLWLPPMQEASTYDKFSYATLIAAYDNLKDNSNYPGTIEKHTYSKVGKGDKPLYHYRFTPANYTKTFYVQATIHGKEKDAAQTVFRIMDIICNHCNEAAYSRLRPLRDNVRFIVVPCASPWAFDNSTMNFQYTDWNGEDTYIDEHGQVQPLMLNPNRNTDFNHQFGVSSGTGGNYPWQVPETEHIKSVVESIGIENIDYLVDNHDGGDVSEHFWINYNADGANAPVIRQLISDLIAYEEDLIDDGGTDYRHNGQWVIPNCNDCAAQGTGICAAWFNDTLGALGSVCEYMGGYFGYGFTAEQMTRSLRIRANLLIYAYEMINTKGWRVSEPQDAEYFHFDYPFAMTRQGLRIDGSDTTNSHTIVTQDNVYDRWDALAENYPTYVTKSAKLGENSSGDSIYSYTLGNGNKKVLLLGGSMRYAVDNKITEFGMYVLAEYLCNAHIVARSAFLQMLKQNYTIVVLPCIDIISGNNDSAEARFRSLNNSFSTFKKWQVGTNGCERVGTFADSGIFVDWIDAHSDAIALISGGELETTASTVGKPDYSTDYMTQVIIPKNLTELNEPEIHQWLDSYCSHLEDDRGEDTPVVQFTDGATCGDYAYDNYDIPTFFINLNVSQMWAARQQYMASGDTSDKYMYRNYETGRRIANIVNFILMAGGDINND